VNFAFSSSDHWAPNLMIFGNSNVPIFKEMVSPTFLFVSSSLCVSFLPTSLDENKLPRGVKTLGNLSSSTEMIYLGLSGSFCMKEKIPSSLRKNLHDSMLSWR
jgi:hypothetical protein